MSTEKKMVDNTVQETCYDSFIDFPSKIVRFNIISRDAAYPVIIPINEVFRINEIFQEHTYSIMKLNNQNKPLNIIDVGANIGLFAIYMKCLNPENVIHCFEPSPSTFRLLKKNVGNIKGINIYPYGLFNSEGVATMYLNNDNTGENSIKATSSESQDIKEMITIPLKETNSEFDKLNITALNVLKIDTEGCEADILENIKHRLDAIDYILLEYHSEKDRRTIDNILKGFHVVSSKATSYDVGQVKYLNSRLIPSLSAKGFDPELPPVKIHKSLSAHLLDVSKRHSNTLYKLINRILPDGLN
jgi:FkbM family methyltransferase